MKKHGKSMIALVIVAVIMAIPATLVQAKFWFFCDETK